MKAAADQWRCRMNGWERSEVRCTLTRCEMQDARPVRVVRKVVISQSIVCRMEHLYLYLRTRMYYTIVHLRSRSYDVRRVYLWHSGLGQIFQSGGHVFALKSTQPAIPVPAAPSPTPPPSLSPHRPYGDAAIPCHNSPSYNRPKSNVFDPRALPALG